MTDKEMAPKAAAAGTPATSTPAAGTSAAGTSAAGTAPAVSAWLEVTRPDDLLALSFGLVNLTVQDGCLVRADPAAPARIIVSLPPQHVAEASVPGDVPSVAPMVGAVLAGGSQLAFTVPDGVTSLPLNLPTLLGWAALQPVPPAQPPGSPGPPDESGSILELPYRMQLAVDAAQWQHPTAAVIDPATATAELWRTTATAPALHVAWSRDRDPEGTNYSVYPLVYDPLQGLRAAIAGQAPALETDRLTLSALGATASLHASMPEPITGSPAGSPVTVTDWHHVMSVGRDSYVRTVQMGYLAPFGHRAAIVTVTERTPVLAADGGNAAAPLEELVSTSRIVVLTPQMDYTTAAAAAAYASPDAASAYLAPATASPATASPATASPAAAAPDLAAPAASAAAPCAAMTLPLRTVRLPDLTGPVPVDANLATAGGFIKTAQGPFSFRAVAEDLSGQAVELSLPMAFIPDGMTGIPSFYQSLAVAEASNGVALAQASLNGQSVALAGVPGAAATVVDQLDNTVLPVDSMTFGLFSPPDLRIPFLPQMKSAAVRMLSASGVLGGPAAPWTIAYHPSYLLNGLDATLNPGAVFAAVTGSPTLAMAAAAAGGLAAPQLNINGLSQSLGPVAGAAQLAAGAFDPTQLLKGLDDATLLGGIKLREILAPVEAPLEAAGFDPAKVPGFVRTQLPHAIQTTFTWKPPLSSTPVVPTPPPGDSAAFGNPGDAPPAAQSEDGTADGDPASADGPDKPFLTIDLTQAALSLNVTATVPLDPAQTPTSVIQGELTNFGLDFLGAVIVHFDWLRFTATSGRKVDLTTGPGVTVTFARDLAFVNQLAQALPGDGFSDAPYVDCNANGITAGYTLAIPSVGIGVVSMSNIAFVAALSLPLAAPPAVLQPLGLRLGFSSREHPFMVSISFIGGGGYFCADVGSDGIHLIEGSLDLGANLSVDFVVVSAEVHALAGFSFSVSPKGTNLTAFLRIGGSINLLGLISVSVELYLALGYSSDHSAIEGTASLTIGVHVLFITKSVTLSVHKSFPVPGSGSSPRVTGARAAGPAVRAPRAAGAVPAVGLASTHGIAPANGTEPADSTGAAGPLPPPGSATPPGPRRPGPVSFGDVMSPDAWGQYLGAFA